MRGKLIVIEGTDCSGKETQSKLLIEKLNKNNIKCEYFSFPEQSVPSITISLPRIISLLSR